MYDEICGGLDSLSLGGVEMNSRAYATMFGFKVLHDPSPYHTCCFNRDVLFALAGK